MLKSVRPPYRDLCTVIDTMPTDLGGFGHLSSYFERFFDLGAHYLQKEQNRRKQPKMDEK